MWKWRDLTILGRIQIVKTFVIPMFMYRASLICVQKDIVIEVNKLLFKFIWKGKDKVKRLSLICDLDKGGLKAPHLESIIKSQRIMCCKCSRFAGEENTRDSKNTTTLLTRWRTLTSTWFQRSRDINVTTTILHPPLT